MVSAAELYAQIDAEAATPDETANGGDGTQYEVVNPEGNVVMRTNQHIVDRAANQRLSAEDIEALRQEDTSSGKDVIAKILESHSTLDQKTSFALAKYTLRKTKKYMKRFTVLPLDVPLLADWILNNKKDSSRIMDMREETLALMCSWANVHCGTTKPAGGASDSLASTGDNRWLIVDDTGGLVISAMAERMGILYPNIPTPPGDTGLANATESKSSAETHDEDMKIEQDAIDTEDPSPTFQNKANPAIFLQETAMSATSDSITLVHSNPQPNLWLLSFFGYDVSSPDPLHPLHTNLRTLTWLQLLHPEEDSAYKEPEFLSDTDLYSMKGSKKGAYYRKRRRWQRIKSVVDDTRAGNFEGLIVSSFMAPETILHHAVPLLKGGSQVVVYSPTIEPLTKLVDCYSTPRRVAFAKAEAPRVPSEEFPVNPLLLLAPTIHTTRVRPWQVLPGRTHPKMMGRGGAEGYIFVAIRVLPLEGKVEARGTFRKRKADVVSLNPSRNRSPNSAGVKTDEGPDKIKMEDESEVPSSDPHLESNSMEIDKDPDTAEVKSEGKAE